MVANHPHLRGRLRRASEGGASIAVSPQVLARIEASCRGITKRARPDTVAARALRLRCVLHNPYASPLSQRYQVYDRCGLTVQVDRDDCIGPFGYRRFYSGSVDEIGPIVDAVNEHGNSADPRDCLGRGDEGVGREDALVTRTNTEGPQCDLDSIGSVRCRYAVVCPDEIGVLALEERDLRAADKRGAGQHLVPAFCDLLANGSVL